MNLLRFALLLFIPVTLAVACKPEVIQCPGNTVMVENQCSCELPYYGIDCEKMDSCIAPNQIDYKNCNGFDCHRNTCKCVGFYSGKLCENYRPNELIGTYEIVQLEIDDEFSCYEKPLVKFTIQEDGGSRDSDRFYFNTDFKSELFSYFIGFTNGILADSDSHQIILSFGSARTYGRTTNFKFNGSYLHDTIIAEGEFYKFSSRGGPNEKQCVAPANLVAIKIASSP